MYSSAKYMAPPCRNGEMHHLFFGNTSQDENIPEKSVDLFIYENCKTMGKTIAFRHILRINSLPFWTVLYIQQSPVPTQDIFESFYRDGITKSSHLICQNTLVLLDSVVYTTITSADSRHLRELLRRWYYQVESSYLSKYFGTVLAQFPSQ